MENISLLDPIRLPTSFVITVAGAIVSKVFITVFGPISCIEI